MANAAGKLRAIAWTAFQETLRRKVFYIVAFLLVLFAIGVGSGSVTVNMATEAGETDVVTRFHTDVITWILSTWSFSTKFLAIYLGAVSVSSEISFRTIVNVLARPVRRSTYLVGRWIGILAFLWPFQLIGVLVAMAAMRYWHTPHTPMLWLGLAGTFTSALLFSGVSLGLSVAMPPIVAGGLAFFLPYLPLFVSDWLTDPHWYLRGPANAVYLIAPAKMPIDLVGESFAKELLHPDYSLYAQVLGENALYAIALFVLACAIFERRQLRLR